MTTITTNNEQSEYEAFFVWAKKELTQLKERHDINVKSVIEELARKLDTAGMPRWMICSEISRQLKGYCHSRYIRDSLDDKYKDESKVREQSTSHSRLNTADDGKKEIEVLSGGIEDVAVHKHKLDADIEADGKRVMQSLYNDTAADEPTVFLDAETAKKYEESIKKAAAINDEILAENQTLGQHIEELKKQNLEKDVENEELKKQLQVQSQNQQQHHKQTSDSEELEKLSQKELIERVQELSYALEQTQPFQTAAEIATPAPASGSGKEVIIPGKLFRTILSILRGGEDNSIYLTIRGNEVIGLEGHNERVKREKEDIVK